MDRRHVLVFILILTVYLAPLLYLPDGNPKEAEYEYSISVIFRNTGDSPVALVPSMRVLNLFPNATWQSSRLTSTKEGYIITKDNENNPVLNVNVVNIPDRANLTLFLSERVTKAVQEKPSLDFAKSGVLDDIPSSLRVQSIQNSSTWQTENPELRALANETWNNMGRSRNVLRIATSLADWVGKNIVPTDHDAPYGPLETYESRIGDCDDQAVLLITLLRILGVPAYLQVGALWTGQSVKDEYWNGTVVSMLTNVAYHGWAMVYIPPWGWLPFDMTLAWQSEQALAVTRNAPVLTEEAFPMMDLTTTDWVKEGRDQKGWFQKSGLTSHEEHSLRRIKISNSLDTVRMVYPWILATVAVATTVIFIASPPKLRLGKGT